MFFLGKSKTLWQSCTPVFDRCCLFLSKPNTTLFVAPLSQCCIHLYTSIDVYIYIYIYIYIIVGIRHLQTFFNTICVQKKWSFMSKIPHYPYRIQLQRNNFGLNITGKTFLGPLSHACPEFSPKEFSPTEFSSKEFLPNGIFAEQNFCRTEFSPNVIFAEWNFRRRNFRRTEFSPKNKKIHMLIFGCVLRILL